LRCLIEDGGIIEDAPLMLGDDEYFLMGDNRNHTAWTDERLARPT
jgi:hypothetical protein